MNQKLFSFSSMEDASAAVEALVAAGLPRESLELRVLEDEAGPVAGNFLVGNGRASGGRSGADVRAGPEGAYDENFRTPVHRGTHLLVLSGLDDAQLARAGELLGRFDAVSPEQKAAAADA
jgi:hypothetical protein